EPISIQLTVTGTGNLDTLAPPELAGNPPDWKSYPPHRLPRQGVRHDASGVTTFSQVIRPNGSQKVIPPYQLISFDPDSEQYITATTQPIPFDLVPSTPDLGLTPSVLPDLDTPVEEMESTLGLINPRKDPPASPPGLWRSWHLLPALLALALLVQIIRIRLLPRFARPTRELELQQALTSIEQAGTGSRDFLRATGAFIEQWIPEESRDEETLQLLARRDHHCYQRESNEPELKNPERLDVIKHLRRRALEIASLLLFLVLLGPGEARANGDDPPPRQLYQQAEAAWNKNAYNLAIHLYHEAHENDALPADVLYNIGNCYFRLGEQGLATLYYRRALHQHPGHPEASQNLRFLKRKTGAITMERPGYQKWLEKLP
ncbi:MAG: tetratricopeptide repeat protein, partial [Roseibacillus sp.]|nr:tetratricopeptide repeat protein [Roseibacillus sp.]